MSKKVTNNLVSDIKRDHILDDRTTYNQLNWLLTGFVQYLDKTIERKELTKADILAQADVEAHALEGSQEQVDWTKLERDYEWHNTQQEITQTLRDYFAEACDQLFPEVNAKAKSQADSQAFFAKLRKAS